MTSTHKGKDWVFYRFEEPGAGAEKAGPIWHTSVYENPFLPEGYIPSLEAMYKGEWAKQELLGMHATFEGLIYAEFERSRHVWTGEYPKFSRMIYGVDWGFWYAPVLAIGLIDGTDQWLVASEWYGKQVKIGEQVNAAIRLVSEFDEGYFYPDPSRPENIREFRDAGLYVPEFEPGKIDEGILHIQNLLGARVDGKPGLLIHESCRNTIMEMEGWQWERRRDKVEGDPDRFKSKPADGQLDHALDALRYALMGARSKGKVVAVSIPPDPAYTTAKRFVGRSYGQETGAYGAGARPTLKQRMDRNLN
jgi:phage terminase large subunit